MQTHQTFAGIYENGVIRPLTPLALPEATPVSIVVSTEAPTSATSADASTDGMDAIYEILSRRHDTGIHDLAERHNEHQP